MPCEDWLDIERLYRIAVHTYCDAVDRLDSARDFDGAWQQIESARTDADRARSTLLGHQRKHLCVPMRGSSGLEEISDSEANVLILGDQGQSGG